VTVAISSCIQLAPSAYRQRTSQRDASHTYLMTSGGDNDFWSTRDGNSITCPIVFVIISPFVRRLETMIPHPRLAPYNLDACELADCQVPVFCLDQISHRFSLRPIVPRLTTAVPHAHRRMSRVQTGRPSRGVPHLKRQSWRIAAMAHGAQRRSIPLPHGRLLDVPWY
jgi:hypothetical protein